MKDFNTYGKLISRAELKKIRGGGGFSGLTCHYNCQWTLPNGNAAAYFYNGITCWTVANCTEYSRCNERANGIPFTNVATCS